MQHHVRGEKRRHITFNLDTDAGLLRYEYSKRINLNQFVMEAIDRQLQHGQEEKEEEDDDEPTTGWNG